MLAFASAARHAPRCAPPPFPATHAEPARILFLHGLGGTPGDLRPLTEVLRQAGSTVATPRLPGHGDPSASLARRTGRDWTAAAEAALDAAAKPNGRCVVGGLGLGAVLALHLAQIEPRRVSALVLLSPTLRLDGWATSALTRAAMHWPTWLPVDATIAEAAPHGLRDAWSRRMLAESFRAGRTTDAGRSAVPISALAHAGALSRSVAARLGDVRQPALIVHARQDDIASLANAQRLERELAGPVETMVLDDSHHLVTLDRQRSRVAARVAAFINGVG